ncbi:MAG: hypothetical protein HC788_09390 [Sphingopyxis sp.]|nr:hypothetical protein [Sphingopyxis sp.]
MFRDNEGVVRAVQRAFVGLTNVPVTLAVRDGATNAARQVVLNRQAANAGRTLAFESKRIDDTIGYIRFSLFVGDVVERVRSAMKELESVKTLIVDLRGNGGGIGDFAPILAGMLSDKPGSLGESKFRYDTREFSFTPSQNAFSGKLIILVDGFSASTSEVFSGGLQNNKRATIVGETTIGAVLPSLLTQLPTGGALQYAISDFRLKDQTVLEGRGVIPNVAVGMNKRDVVAGRDTVLQRAIQLARR